jgi:hypothetical protein
MKSVVRTLRFRGHACQEELTWVLINVMNIVDGLKVLLQNLAILAYI